MVIATCYSAHGVTYKLADARITSSAPVLPTKILMLANRPPAARSASAMAWRVFHAYDVSNGCSAGCRAGRCTRFAMKSQVRTTSSNLRRAQQEPADKTGRAHL